MLSSNIAVDPCTSNHGGCNHFCFTLSSTTRICDCALGFYLDSDNVTCNPRKSHGKVTIDLFWLSLHKNRVYSKCVNVYYYLFHEITCTNLQIGRNFVTCCAPITFYLLGNVSWLLGYDLTPCDASHAHLWLLKQSRTISQVHKNHKWITSLI